MCVGLSSAIAVIRARVVGIAAHAARRMIAVVFPGLGRLTVVVVVLVRIAITTVRRCVITARCIAITMWMLRTRFLLVL